MRRSLQIRPTRLTSDYTACPDPAQCGHCFPLTYLPYVEALLASLPEGPLVLVMDGSEAGRDCVLLCLNVIYQQRALPLCWLAVKGKLV